MARFGSSSTAGAASASNRNRGVLMLAAIFGILSAALMFAFLSSRGGDDDTVQKALTDGAFDTVWVASQDIKVGEEISPGMLESATLPAIAILTGAVKDDKEVVGKVATAPIFKGEQVTIPKVTAFANQTSLAFQVPQGKRAVSVQIPHEAWNNAGLPQPGDLVDVLVLMALTRIDPLTGAERPDVVAGYLGQNIEVLAVSQSVVKRVPKIDSAAAKDGSTTTGAVVDSGGVAQEEPKNFNEAISVTLAMTPDQAAKLSIVDALDDKIGQYRILTKRKGDIDGVEKLTAGVSQWSIDEVFTSTSKK